MPAHFDAMSLNFSHPDAEKEKQLYELAQEYHRQTEAYDRMVCTGRIHEDGGIMPATAREHGLINRNALATRKRLFEENPGPFTWEEWCKAIPRNAPRGNP